MYVLRVCVCLVMLQDSPLRSLIITLIILTSQTFALTILNDENVSLSSDLPLLSYSIFFGNDQLIILALSFICPSFAREKKKKKKNFLYFQLELKLTKMSSVSPVSIQYAL